MIEPMSLSLTFEVPPHDLSEFQSLPDTVREDVKRALGACKTIHESDKKRPAIQRLALVHNNRPGFTFESLRAKYYWYALTGKKASKGLPERQPGDWRCFVNYARCQKLPKTARSDAVALPPDFVEFLRGLFQQNKRKSAPAMRKLYRLWHMGESIPGYGTWQEWFFEHHPLHPLPQHCPPDLPEGWSKSNLGRYIPEEADLALAREGIAAARQYIPSILNTRDGLRPLEFVMFDDVRTDFRIIVPGFISPIELNLLVALDLATGMILRYGLRPAIPREDGVKEHLRLHDMKCLIAGLLLQYGVPIDYVMTLVVENATAAIRDATERALSEFSGNHIAVSRTMMICGTAIWAGYKDKAGGNPRGKAALESTFNLMHNELADLPGQIGRRYDQGPSELAGRTKEAEALARTSRHLTVQQRMELRLPFLNSDQARVGLTDMFNRLIHRTDHAMEGFAVVGEFREVEFEQWRPECELLGLPPERRGQVLWRNPPRRESPLERWDRLVNSVGGVNAFSKPHAGAVARLYEEHLQKEITNSEITFKFEKQQYVYRIANLINAEAQRTQRNAEKLQNGEKVLIYFDPQDLAMIHVTDGQGGYLGSIPRTRGIRRGDKEALKTEFEAQRKALHEVQDRVSARMPEVAEEHIADMAHNTEVLTNALEDAQAIDIAPIPGPSTPDTRHSSEPEFSAAIGAAKLQAQVAQRQAAARIRSDKDLARLADKALLAHVRT